MYWALVMLEKSERRSTFSLKSCRAGCQGRQKTTEPSQFLGSSAHRSQNDTPLIGVRTQWHKEIQLLCCGQADQESLSKHRYTLCSLTLRLDNEAARIRGKVSRYSYSSSDLEVLCPQVSCSTWSSSLSCPNRFLLISTTCTSSKASATKPDGHSSDNTELPSATTHHITSLSCTEANTVEVNRDQTIWVSQVCCPVWSPKL